MNRAVPFLIFVLLILLFFGCLGYYFWLDHSPKENPFDPIIVQISKEQGMDPFLIRAVIWRETKFNPHLPLGLAQERGLMQVTPDAGRAWAKANKIVTFQEDDLYDPVTNIRAGTWYLAHALRHWVQTDDPATFALAEYNAGRSNALKWVDPNDKFNHLAFLDRITFPSTRRYVEVILAKRDEYKRTLATNPWYKDYLESNTPAN